MKNTLHKLHLLVRLALLCVSLFFVACSSSTSEPEANDYRFVMKTDSGIFRGAYLGMPINDLLKTEPVKPEQLDASTALFLMSKDSVEFAFTCELDEGKIIEMEADVSLPTAQRAADLVSKLKEHYDQTIGEHVTGKGALYWNAERNGEVFNIELSDVSPVEGGRVMITIHP